MKKQANYCFVVHIPMADQTLAELIKESFRFFLQKSFLPMAIRQPM